MKIYDGFTFFNELDLLEIRFEELYNHVDYFIIVESDHTFTNIPKPYYFEENKDRFVKFSDKIIHIKIKSNKSDDPWKNEFEQRNNILQGCTDAADNDLIIISDVDEIPRPNIISSMRTSNNDVYALYTPFFYYKFNYVSTHEECYLPIIISAKVSIVKTHGVQTIRETRRYFSNKPFQYENYNCKVIHHAGWHFGYMGDSEFIKHKLVSFSHSVEIDTETKKNFNVDAQLSNGDPLRFFVKIDEYFPETILKNFTKYQQYIVNGEFPSVSEVYLSNGLKKYE